MTTIDGAAPGHSTLSVVVGLHREAARVESARLRSIADWAVARSAAPDPVTEVLAGMERALQVGGSGTPAIREFVAAELQAELGVHLGEAQRLIADALTLVHRLPKVFAMLESGDVDPHRARLAAAGTRGLRLEAAAALDDYLASSPRPGAPRRIATLTRPRLTKILEQHTLVEPDDRSERQVALDSRHLDITHTLFGTAEINGRLSTADAIRLESAVQAGVEELRSEGDERGHDVLRAAAVGRLAIEAVLGSGASTVLYVHHDRASDTFSVDDVGPISKVDATELLGHTGVEVRAVIDLAAEITSTGYVASGSLREQTWLQQDRVCCFPHCDRLATDFDHIEPYPSGSTSSGNGQGLCEFHHRVKTHGRWRVRYLGPSAVEWSSPLGTLFTVIAGHTTKLRT